MKYRKILLSSTFAIAMTLTGVLAVQGSADAATTDNTNDAAATTEVAQTATVGEVGKTAEVGVAATTGETAPTATTADNGQATSTTPAKEVTAATAGTAATVAIAEAPTDAATTPNTQATAVADQANSQAAATNAGDTTTAPAGTSNPTFDNDKVTTTIKNAETIPVVANVVAGATGLVAPTTNKWGNAVHSAQNSVISAVGKVPLVGPIAATVMKIAQPLDLVDNVVGGVYGFATGKSDQIPDPDNSDEEYITPVSTAHYTNNQHYGTVTTNDQAPLYDQVGVLQSRSLAPNTDWYTDITRVNTDTNTTYYRVSTNEYVNAQDVSVLFD